MFISRAFTPVECRYVQIEEALALAWACERFSDYIVGKSIVAETDQKPLVPLLTTCTLDEFPLEFSGLECASCVFILKR